MGSQGLTPRIVFDTNVVISTLLFRTGRLAWLREAWQGGQVRPIVSKETTQEILRVLAYPKFALTAEEISDLLSEYLPFAEMVPEPDARAEPQAKDPKDQPFVNLALEAAADWVVSGDAHLLSLDGRHGLRVISPSDFAALMQKV